MPYDVKDVRAAFKSGGVGLVTSRLDERGCPTDPSFLFPAEVCSTIALRNRKHAPELPHLIGLTASGSG